MTIVKKTFLVFMLSFLVQLVVIAFLLGIGFKQSENAWRQIRLRESYETALTGLEGNTEEFERSDYQGQIALYDTNRKLMATTHGMGMRGGLNRNLMADKFNPVYKEDTLLGYYTTNEVSFRKDSANQALLNSMLWVLVASLLLSFGIALLATWYFSRKVSKPADNMALALQAMTEGEISIPIKTSGSDELVQIANSIESLRQRLVYEKTVRSRWSQDVAHDLRSPVAAVKAQLEGMSDGILDPTKERFDRTIREIGRIESLIVDLEMLIRLESPETNLQKATISTQELGEELSHRFANQCSLKSITFTTNIENFSFVGDMSLLLRAISNLVQNAIQHGDDGQEVSLGIHRGGSGIRFSVHNTGTPIPPDEISKIFERLYRGEYARSSPGSGLGLTIVERIVALHRGVVTVESNPDSGTTFTIEIPLLTI